jgi:hypothetical protein
LPGLSILTQIKQSLYLENVIIVDKPASGDFNKVFNWHAGDFKVMFVKPVVIISNKPSYRLSILLIVKPGGNDPIEEPSMQSGTDLQPGINNGYSGNIIMTAMSTP